jgi:hypothetical protein
MIRAETDKRSPAIAEGRSRDGSLSVAAPGREPSRMDCPGVCVAQESDDGLTNPTYHFATEFAEVGG